MPRISPEARGASIRNAGLTPPPPPKDLSPEARDIWVAVTRSKPADWWGGEAALRLLRRFCRLSVLAEQLHDRVDRIGLDNADAEAAIKQLLSISVTMGTLATKLRLSVQNGVERHSAHRFETGSGRPWEPLSDAEMKRELLGGNATRRLS